MRIGNYGEYKEYHRVFITFRNKKKHLFRKFNGLGISTSVLDKIKKLGCRKIKIVYDTGEEQVILYTLPNKFYEKGIIYRYKDADHQRILPLRYFKQVGKCKHWLENAGRYCDNEAVIAGYCMRHL